MPQSAVRLLLAVGVLAVFSTKVQAFPDFQKAFVAKYCEENSDEDFCELIKKAKCFVCHFGKSKKNMNAYGLAVSEYIGKPDRKDIDKINETLEKVAGEHFDPEDEESPTFGERMAEGKLPGGELDELKKRKKED